MPHSDTSSLAARYFLEIAYHGKAYHGWQIQPNALTVQEILNDRLRKLLRDEQVYVVGSGRTDTGVHCRQQFAHFDTHVPFAPDDLCHKLNAFLPHDLAVARIFPVPPTAHARFSATFRRYEYHIHHQKKPFLQDFSWQLAHIPDFDKMNEAASYLTQYQSFESFCKTNTQNEHFLCEVTEAYWEERTRAQAVFHIRANRFLRGMVRLIVGELVKVGQGRKTPSEFRDDLAARAFSKQRTSAPAQGLFLCEVGYPAELVPIST